MPANNLRRESSSMYLNGIMPQASPAPVLSQSGAAPYSDLAAILNQFMTQQARQPFEANLPGYGTNLAQQSFNTGSMLRGEVPLDVQRQIQQSGAERGIATGSPGSSNANAAWLRALGLTSLGLQQQGSQQFSQQQADTPIPELFNPASLFIPQVLAENEAGYAREGAAAGRAAAMPSAQPYTGYNWGTGGSFGAPTAPYW